MIRYNHFLVSIMLLTVFSAANAQLNGSYTINSAVATGGTNYQSFNDFAAALSANDISGNVIATVIPGSGPYQEQVVFSTMAGSSANAVVTIEGNGETISAVTTTTDRHVVRLSDVQYFNINNLRVAWDSSSTGGFYGIHIYNTGSHITISNCKVDISGTSSTLYGAYIASGSTTSILEAGDFHDLNIINDTAVGGGYGASVFGLLSPLASNILISGNVFLDFHSNGVYLRETDGAVISNNYLDKTTENITSCNAIQIAQSANINANIFDNFIRLTQMNNGTVTFRGIYLFDGTGHKVYNNVIYDVQLISGNFTGIEVRTGGTAPEIYFNTISIDNPNSNTGDLFGIKEELSNTNSVLRNNLISITQTTAGIKAGLVLGAIATVTSAFNSDYNLLYVPGGNTAIKNSLTPVDYLTLADWQSVSQQDANSVALDPMFVSLTFVQPTNPAANDKGTPISWITTDVSGVARGVVPDIGAYEFGFPTNTEQLPSEALIHCYPNPASSFLTIENLSGQPLPDLLMYDLSGKLMLRKQIQSGITVMDLKGIDDGMYLLQFRREGMLYERKLAVTHGIK